MAEKKNRANEGKRGVTGTGTGTKVGGHEEIQR